MMAGLANVPCEDAPMIFVQDRICIERWDETWWERDQKKQIRIKKKQIRYFFFTSIIVVYLDSFNLDWYPSRFVPMYFFLGTHCGGRRCALPPAPPTRVFLNRFPLLPTILFVFHKHHRLFGFILSWLISIEICAYVLLSWYALRGEALRPPPCTPPPAFIS